MASSVAKLFVQIDANSAGFSKALGDVERRVAGLGSKMQSVGQSISKAGVGLTAGVTLPIVAGVGAAAKAAIDWESAFAGVRKTVNATEPELMALSAGIQDLSKTIPVSATELAGIAEIAGQLGVKTGNILDFTETIAALGVTTNLSVEEAATSLAQFANITGLPQDQIDRLGSTIVALGNNLATTERDIVNMAQRLAGAGSTAGLTEAEILSFAGALSSVGIEAESGGTAFSRILVDMANAAASGGKDLEKFASVAGVSANDFAQEFKDTPAKAMLSFIKGLQGIQDAGGNVFATLEDLGLADIRVRDALLRAAGAGDLFSDALTLGNQAWAENTALTNEAAQRYGTTASKLQILKNQLVGVLTTVGGPFISAMTAALSAAAPLFRAIENGANAFAAMSPEMQTTIIAGLGILAALGPVLIIVGNLITVIGGAITAFSSFSGVIAAVAAFLTGPIGIAIGVIALAIAGLALAWKNNWFDIQGKTEKAVAAISAFWTTTLLPAIQTVGEWLQTNLFPILGDLAQLWLAAVGLQLQILGTAFRVWWGIVVTVAGIVRNVLGSALQWAIDLFSRMGVNVDWVREKIQSAITWITSLSAKLSGLTLPSWLGGGGDVSVNSTTTGTGTGFGGVGGGPGISPQAFTTGTSSGTVGRATVNNLNAPIVGTITVNSEADKDDLIRRIQAVLAEDFDLSVGAGTRVVAGGGF